MNLAETGCNIQVLALAGCGKTTTSLAVAKHIYQTNGRKTMLLTYNKDLQLDTAKRIRKLQISSYCKAFTVHGALSRFSGQVVYKDSEVKKVLTVEGVLIHPIEYDTFIIDEAQDLTPLLYEAVCLLLRKAQEYRHDIQIIILGDIMQRIYMFRDARSEYLLYPNTHFTKPLGLGGEFACARLSVNFRCSKKILEFVNRLINPEQFLHHPLYREWFLENHDIIRTAWGVGLEPCARAIAEDHLYPPVFEMNLPDKLDVRPEKTIEVHLDNEIKKHWSENHKNEDIYIVAYSYDHPNSYVYKALNQLGKTCDFYYSNESESRDERLRKGKITVSTIHNMKGREGRHVKVFAPSIWNERNMYNSQKESKINEENETLLFDPSEVFNLLYVSLTRAIASLSVYWTSARPTFVQNGTSIQQLFITRYQKPKTHAVYQLCRHASDSNPLLQQDALCTVDSYDGLGVMAEDLCCFATATSREFSGRGYAIENYSCIIGLAVEMAIAERLNLLDVRTLLQQVHSSIKLWCYCKKGCVTVCGLNLEKFVNFHCESMERQETPGALRNWEYLLELAKYRHCMTNPLMLRQLVGLGEINVLQLEECVTRGVDLLSRCNVSNQCISYHNEFNQPVLGAEVCGECDFMFDSSTVIECKITKEIVYEHILQTLMYSALSGSFGSPCYIMAPNLNQLVCVKPVPGLTASKLLELVLYYNKN